MLRSILWDVVSHFNTAQPVGLGRVLFFQAADCREFARWTTSSSVTSKRSIFGTLLGMTPEERNRLYQLCAQIETETDHRKFLRLMQELNQLLQGKEGRLERTTLPQDLGSAS